MEVRKRLHIRCIIFVIFITFIFLSGCGKRWYDVFDENYVWVSENPYIYMIKEGTIIEVDGEKKNVELIWSFGDGSKIEFYDRKGRDYVVEDVVWEAEMQKFKKDKLYLKIVKDYYGNDEGKEIVLEKRLKEE